MNEPWMNHGNIYEIWMTYEWNINETWMKYEWNMNEPWKKKINSKYAKKGSILPRARGRFAENYMRNFENLKT